MFGFLSLSDGLKVHKNNCPNALGLQSNYAYRVIQAKWIDSSQQEFTAIIKMTGIDNIGLVNDVTKVISSNMHVNIKNIHFETNDGIFSGKITVSVKNNNLVKTLMDRIKKVNGIEKVHRV